MAGRFVALLAEERGPRFQQIGVGRAVRVVTVRAVFGHRLVIEDERSALLHVAGVAGVDDGIADQQLDSGGAMRVVGVLSVFCVCSLVLCGAVELTGKWFYDFIYLCVVCCKLCYL